MILQTVNRNLDSAVAAATIASPALHPSIWPDTALGWVQLIGGALAIMFFINKFFRVILGKDIDDDEPPEIPDGDDGHHNP